MADDTMDLNGLGTPGIVPVPGGDPGPVSLTPPTPTAVPGPEKSPMAIQPPPDVPGNHSKLIGMLQGLAVATGAFGKALATHGKEGGVQDVLAYEQNQKNEARAQADQKMKQADFETRQKYMNAQTNSLIVRTQTDLAK